MIKSLKFSQVLASRVPVPLYTAVRHRKYPILAWLATRINCNYLKIDKKIAIQHFLRNRSWLFTKTRYDFDELFDFNNLHFTDWHKDFKADAKVPKTKEEIEKAAKKYNLHPSEYKTYEDDGLGWGDYPKLPDEPYEARPLHYAYDMPEHKRNFGEPIHIDYPMWSEDRYGTAAPTRYSIRDMFATFGIVMTGWFALYFWLEDKKMFLPTLEKQYPDKTRYTFEPAN